MTRLVAGIEGGGSKFICALGATDGEILAETRIPTTSPHETLGRVVSFLQQQTRRLGKLSSIGIACFGPLALQPDSAKFGQILPTPKPGWTGTDMLTPFRTAFGAPIGLDTDVNGAALGEWRWGAAQGLDNFIYLTIGTGIGGGGMINGKLMHGLLHPEMGHIPLSRNKISDSFTSVCPFHEDCFEGLASGVALEKRWGEKAENIPAGHPAWEVEASYVARALRSLICALSPQRIILGGGVMRHPQLIALIREKTLTELNGYVQAPQILKKIDEYIVPTALRGRAGILGAFLLAERALKTF